MHRSGCGCAAIGTKGIGPEGPPTKVAEAPHDFCGRAFSSDAFVGGPSGPMLFAQLATTPQQSPTQRRPITRNVKLIRSPTGLAVRGSACR
ncbi:DUF6053 domain-containing protein [Lysobacter sp. TAB13]|uniref:DUF6053 domain-containing protein n=1 Tax=Lysobacter sp. TAB13 TaxID=3233065 RepID=UPI003F9B1C14